MGRFVFPNLAIFVIGFGLGVLQWFVLQHRIRKAWRWILVTAAGWSAGAALTFFFVPDGMDFLVGIVVGLAIGVAQWMILRREVHWSAWWIVISIVGWTTGMALLPGLILTGVMVGAVTGIALELLLRYPKLPDKGDEAITSLNWRNKQN